MDDNFCISSCGFELRYFSRWNSCETLARKCKIFEQKFDPRAHNRIRVRARKPHSKSYYDYLLIHIMLEKKRTICASLFFFLPRPRPLLRSATQLICVFLRQT